MSFFSSNDSLLNVKLPRLGQRLGLVSAAWSTWNSTAPRGWWDTSPSQGPQHFFGTSQQFTDTHLYTWVERIKMPKGKSIWYDLLKTVPCNFWSLSTILITDLSLAILRSRYLEQFKVFLLCLIKQQSCKYKFTTLPLNMFPTHSTIIWGIKTAFSPRQAIIEGHEAEVLQFQSC